MCRSVVCCSAQKTWAHNNIYNLVLNSILLQAERDKLEGDVSRLEEELSIIAVASRTLTACTVIPVIGEHNTKHNTHSKLTLSSFSVLLIAIVMAFQPLISSIFGTRDF